MKRICAFLLALILPSICMAEDNDLISALQNTYVSCASINDSIAELKKIATISTALGVASTGTAVGAAVAGSNKKDIDEEAEEIEIRLEELRIISEADPQKTGQDFTDIENQIAVGPNHAEISALVQEFIEEDIYVEQERKELERLTEKSKKLGNWRTGLMAGATATNVVGAVVVGVTNNKIDFEESIANCNDALSKLYEAIGQAKINKEDTKEAEYIADSCSDYSIIDASKITKIFKAVTVSSAVGATTGITGVVLSATANSEDVREDNSDQGRQKEKNLNKTSNVFAAGTAVAGVASTVLSAMQIAEIKKIISIADKCNEALQ
jgi:hypothetical protein